MDNDRKIRSSRLAGHWYSANPAALKNQIQTYLDNVSISAISGDIKGLIVPHAGYMYSGQTAAYGFKAIQNIKPKIIYIFSPLHSYQPGMFFSSSYAAFETPFGFVEVDSEIIQHLKSSLQKNGVDLILLENEKEHAVEIQLPFLQSVYSHNFRIVPLMVRVQQYDRLIPLLSSILNTSNLENALFIASTDLSHFHTDQEAKILDDNMISAFTSLDPQVILQTAAAGTGSACGVSAVACTARLSAQTGANSLASLNYAHSGEISGDHQSVVGYFSGVYTTTLEN